MSPTPKRRRAARKAAAPPHEPGEIIPVEDTPPPPPEVSATFAPDVPDDARAQRLNETPAGRGVVIPTET